MRNIESSHDQQETPILRKSPMIRPILAGSVVIALGIGIYSVLSTLAVRQSTSLITINAFADEARISVRKFGAAAKELGQGKANVRLEPGTYQVTASTGNGATSKVVEVTKPTSAVLDMEGEAFVPIQRIAGYNAQDIYVSPDNTLFFLDKKADIPFMYPLSSDAARPYNGNLSNVRSIQWLGPAQAITESNDGSWNYTENMDTTPLRFNNQPPAMLATNPQNAVAGIAADNTIIRTAQITSPFQAIGKAKYDTAKVDIAPDGTIIVYTPQADSTDPTEPTRIYRNGRFTALDKRLAGISNVTWNTDSTAFSYTTAKGSFTYNLASKLTTQITTGTPTDPRSTLWLNPTQLIYAEDGGIWRYDVTKKASVQLGELQGDLGVQAPFSAAPDGKTIYFSTSVRGENGGTIYSLATNYRSLSEREQKAMEEKLERQSQDAVTYLGIDTFVDNGLTPDQVQSLKYALGQCKETSGRGIEVLRFTDFRMQLKKGPVDTITFRLDVNERTEYNGKLDIQDISMVRLYLYDSKTNKTLCDSQPIITQ